MNNFGEDLRNLLISSRSWLNVAAVLLAATSMYFIFNLVNNNIVQTGLAPEWGALLGGVAALIAVQFTDNKLVYMVYWGFKLFLSIFTKKFWSGNIFTLQKVAAVGVAFIIFAFALARLGLTATLTYFTKDEISYNVVEKPNDHGLSTLLQTRENNKQSNIKEITKQKNKAAKTESKRVAAATREGKQKFDNLFATGHPSWQQDFTNKNDLFMNRLHPRRHKKAIKWRDELLAIQSETANNIAIEKRKVKDLETQLAALMNPNQAADDPTLLTLSNLANTGVDMYDKRTNNIANFTIMADVAIGLFVFMWILLAAYAAHSTGKDVVEKEEKDISLTNVIQTALQSAWAYTITLLPKSFEQKLQVAGAGTSVQLPNATATKQKQKSTPQSSSPTPLSRKHLEEEIRCFFEAIRNLESENNHRAAKQIYKQLDGALTMYFELRGWQYNNTEQYRNSFHSAYWDFVNDPAQNNDPFTCTEIDAYLSTEPDGIAVQEAEEQYERTEQEVQHNAQSTAQNSREIVLDPVPGAVQHKSTNKRKSTSTLATHFQHKFEWDEFVPVLRYKKSKDAQYITKRLGGSNGVRDNLSTYSRRANDAEAQYSQEALSAEGVKRSTEQKMQRNKAWVKFLTHAKIQLEEMERIGKDYAPQQYSEQG